MKKIVLLFALILFAPLVVADSYERWCLNQGEQVDFGDLCNPDMGSLTGPTIICVHNLDNGLICPVLPNTCNTQGLSCTTYGNTTIDSEPPVLEILSPLNGEVYNSRAVLLTVNTDESSNIAYKENQDTGNRWKNVCTNCQSYSHVRSFTEGMNDLTFRAIDRNGNQVYENVIFYIDSKAPRIRNTEPNSGFASGEFSVEFEEDNPETLQLFYGNSQTGMRTKTLNINSDCEQDRTYTCITNADLTDYDEQIISYYFTLSDLGGTSVSSSTEQVPVDNSNPIITNYDVTISGRKANFRIEVEETNFEKITYLELDVSNARERTLCTRLSANVCEKSISFRDGDHEVQIIVYDKAGNTAERTDSFFTDSKKPRISNVRPSRNEFASGNFIIEFTEDNPEILTFEYGNSQTGMHLFSPDLSSNCVFNGKYLCDFDVNLASYDGEEISYEFTLIDRAGQTATASASGLSVDLTFPEITSDISHVIQRTRAEVTLEINEQNFDEATYRNNADSNPRDRMFCSRLGNDNTCTKTISLRSGTNDLVFSVFDEAGNSVTTNYEIII